MKRKHLVLAVWAVWGWLVAAPSLLAQEAGTVRPWAHETSDLPVDPRIHFGALPNGMRYAWLHQPLPNDSSIHLRLHVAVGSLAEEDDELGMAHFVEHMAFNGTRNFPAATLVQWFQEQGVRFGHDQNAYTSTDETVYELDLPDADPARLAKALSWLRDVADGLLFEDKEVKAEKGVVDAEERERDSSGLRLFARLEQELIDGTLLARRWPIGKKSVRSRFDAAACRAFYQKWYRPELMTLVVVGDLTQLDAERLVAESFASLAATGPVPVMPAPGTAAVSPRSFCVYDAEAKSCQVVAARARPCTSELDSVALRQRQLLHGAAFGIVNARLQRLAREPGSAIDGVAFGLWNHQDLLEGPALTVRCVPDKWQEAFSLAAGELQRALRDGFTQEEGRETFRELAGYLALEPSAELMSMEEYVGELLQAANGDHVPGFDVAVRKGLRPLLEGLNAERLHQTLAAEWKAGETYLFASGGLDLGKGAAAELERVWRESGERTATANPETQPEEPVTFLYRAPGAEGEFVSQELDEELQVARLELDNGVRVTLRPTAEINPGASLYVRFGDGYLAVEPDEADVGWVTGSVFLQSGLGEHSLAELRRALRGQGLAFDFDVQPDHCAFTGGASADSFQRLCEVLCAYLQDPGWRQDAFAEFQADLPRFYEATERGFRGPLAEFELLLHGGDLRFGMPDKEMVESFLLDTLQEFLQPQLDAGAMEVTVVTGMDADATGRILARTFGRLPQRAAPTPREDRLVSPPLQPGLKFRREIESTENNAHVTVVYPTGDGIDPAQRHGIELLAAVLDNRVRVEIREKKGAAYSPSVTTDLSATFPGVGEIRIDTDCEPRKVDQVLKDCLALGDALAKKGVAEGELAEVRSIARTELEQSMRQDGWWLDQLASMWSRPDTLEELRGLEHAFDAITLDTIDTLAKAHLARAKASTAVIVPKKKPAKQ